jgi:hypothetical protein
MTRPAKGAAGVDLGQLMGVADQHDRGTGGAGVLDHGVQVARRQHSRLVDDDHGARAQPVLAAEVELDPQQEHARGADRGLLFEVARRLARDGGAHHDVARGLPRLARRVERERLARPGRADDDVHAVALRRTIWDWSGPIVGRAASARSTAAGSATATPAARSPTARSMTSRSTPSSSRVL